MNRINLDLAQWERIRPQAVVGIDEAGRGAWAGPVVVGAVLFPADMPEDLRASFRDSKRLSARRREGLASLIKETCTWGLGIETASAIDEVGLARAVADAALAALQTVLRAGSFSGAPILLDGNDTNWRKAEVRLALLNRPWYYMERADDLVKEVSAASIIAKVARDTIMERIALLCPAWGFDRHKGYGTPAHIEALQGHGICPFHRRSFKPLRQWAPKEWMEAHTRRYAERLRGT